MNLADGRGVTPFIDSSSGRFSIKSKWLPWVTGSSQFHAACRTNGLNSEGESVDSRTHTSKAREREKVGDNRTRM
jgi:hypothetical protein